MTTTLITGANKGLGRETARRLIAEGHDVWITARNPDLGQEAADALGARFVALDVTDEASVKDAVEAVTGAGTGLDVLINNAGILGPRVPVRETTADHMAEVFDTNVFGLVRVTQAFMPLLEASENPVIVNVSSGVGSLAHQNDLERTESRIVALPYPSSKSAVNMLTVELAKAYPTVRINAADPGHTATDLNGHAGPQTVTEGTDAIVHLAMIDSDGPTGTFSDRYGPAPW